MIRHRTATSSLQLANKTSDVEVGLRPWSVRLLKCHGLSADLPSLASALQSHVSPPAIHIIVPEASTWASTSTSHLHTSFDQLFALQSHIDALVEPLWPPPSDAMTSSMDPASLLQSSSFEPNAILRGAQLTVVGAHRALQNPALFTSGHYKQAALAVAAGIAIRLLVAIPTMGIRLLVRLVCLFADCADSTWDEDVVDAIHHLENEVLQVPFFLMSLMRYLSPAMDQMFMDSLDWVDRTYVQKHKTDNPGALRDMYYPNLRAYESAHPHAAQTQSKKRDPYVAMKAFLMRMGRRAGISLAVYLASFLPLVGRFVLPAASFFTFNKAVGTPAAVVIFGSSLFLPKRYLVMFLQSFFSSRSMMRELVSRQPNSSLISTNANFSHSSSHTSHAFRILKHKRRLGSARERASSTALP